MKKMIAALQISVDGYIEGPNGELDWVAEWSGDMEPTKKIINKDIKQKKQCRDSSYISIQN